MSTPAKKQPSIASFFNKTPKASPKTGPGGPNGDVLKAKTPDVLKAKTPTNSVSSSSKLVPGSLVWARLTGYPWWPALVCKHPAQAKVERKVQGQVEVHVQFLGEQTRAWVAGGLVRRWEEQVDKVQGEREGGEAWRKGVKDAENVTTLSNEERLELLLVDLLPSDEEWSDEEVSPGSKENKAGPASPSKKRRRVMVLDSDDSDGDETFQPSKEDVKLAKDEENDSAASESEVSDVDEPDSSPAKGSKRKMTKKPAAPQAKKPKAASSISSSVGKFASGLPSTPTSSRPAGGMADSTKKKLSMFGAPSVVKEEQEGVLYNHHKLTWLRPEKIKDKEGRRPENPEYDCRTLQVPADFLKSQSPGQKQWWGLKAQYFDVVLFFKMGKFYELYNMDADIGVTELNLVYMRGEQAHAGFPEGAYSKWATTLIEKGYKVARIEQTETPAQLEERNKASSGPKEKVVAREVCQLSTKGTRVNTFLDAHNFEGEPSYLLAICERPGPEFGVAFVDTTLACFHLGQFRDDANLSRLRTLLAHHPPGELLYSRGGLSPVTLSCLAPCPARREVLRPGAEFWDSSKTLRMLAEGEYFKTESGGFEWPASMCSLQEPSDTLGLTATKEGELAVSGLGALVFYLSSAFLDQQLLSQRRFELYTPLGHGEVAAVSSSSSGPQGKYMVLDGSTVANLELLVNTAGGQDSTLAGLFSPMTAMGKRALTQLILGPLLQPAAIQARQAAVKDLMASQHLQQLRLLLKKFPDLERILSKVHAAGDAVKSKNHPDSRAVFFDGDKYNKRKIWDLLSCLDGFRRCSEVLELVAGETFSSKLLREVARLEEQGGHFPDLAPILDYFQAAFDQEGAKKLGRIAPKPGDSEELEEAKAGMKRLAGEMADYLKEQKEHFGCEVKYWGTGKNRFQLEVPVSKIKKASREYELASGTKVVKRYVTAETREFLERQVSAEVQEEAAVVEHQRKIFAKFSQHADTWQKAIACLSLLDCLASLATYSQGVEDGCFPEIVSDFGHPVIDIKEGRHPCLDSTGSFIANDTKLGGGEEGGANLLVLTGPNMGGKSTLMRQTGLLVLLAQMGSQVPAREMTLTPTDRIFTRLGARDDIVGGQSTFFVELQETSSILTHASRHSLVLIDELGRGTATYDGTAIAGSVVTYLAQRRALTLFATHYHCLATEVKEGVAAAHMACMVENEGHEDINEENITFLYKLVEGAAPKSHGFNAAKLAGLPADIIRAGYAKAKQFEQDEVRRSVFKEMFAPRAEEAIGRLAERIAGL